MRRPRFLDPVRPTPPENAAEESPVDFLARWSRRKQAVRRAETAPEPAHETTAPHPEAPPEADHPEIGGALLRGSASDRPPPDEVVEETSLQEPEPPLPALEEITAETDISVFLRKGVASAVRNAALRKMWSLDPAIRDYVGDARDYAYDWNIPGGVPGFGPIDAGYDVEGTLEGMFSRPEAEAPAEPEPATPAPDLEAAGEPGPAPGLADSGSEAVPTNDEPEPEREPAEDADAPPPPTVEPAPASAIGPGERGIATLRRGRATPL